MKKELKPRNGWRSSLIFVSRKAAVASLPEEKVMPSLTVQVEEVFPGLSVLQRSWYLRSPLSVNFADAFAGGKEGVSRTRSVRSSKSRLPSVPVRRTTLIDIIKNKRTPVPA